jgi:hypothetical protein
VIPGGLTPLYDIYQVLLMTKGMLMEESLAELCEFKIVDIGRCKVLGT